MSVKVVVKERNLRVFTDYYREYDGGRAKRELKCVELVEERSSVFEHEFQPDAVHHNYDKQTE